MIEFIPLIIQISLSLAVGLVAVVLYRKSGNSGFAVISIAFFLSAVPNIINMALGGPHLPLRLREWGYTAVEIGMVYTYLTILDIAFQIIFAILVIVGLVELSKRS